MNIGIIKNMIKIYPKYYLDYIRHQFNTYPTQNVYYRCFINKKEKTIICYGPKSYEQHINSRNENIDGLTIEVPNCIKDKNKYIYNSCKEYQVNKDICTQISLDDTYIKKLLIKRTTRSNFKYEFVHEIKL